MRLSLPERPAHVLMQYKSRQSLLVFIGLLICCALVFILAESLPLGTLALQAAFLLLLFLMAFDMAILSGAWKNRNYVLHHLITILFCTAGILEPGLLTGAGCGFFGCYALSGAITKRLRLLRNMKKSHRDRLDKLLKKTYVVLGKADKVVFPAYIIFFIIYRLNNQIVFILVLLVLCTLALLFIRNVLE